ncbi:MAG: hypothetical protein GY753_16955 [Gammaproteobacteria bacterium]|nr:hypothetical protein [Gammaproteobacteria bacterium]
MRGVKHSTQARRSGKAAAQRQMGGSGLSLPDNDRMLDKFIEELRGRAEKRMEAKQCIFCASSKRLRTGWLGFALYFCPACKPDYRGYKEYQWRNEDEDIEEAKQHDLPQMPEQS